MIARLLISDSQNERLKEIKKILTLHIGSVTLKHPDILHFKVGEKLGILEAKKIKDHFSLKPYSAKGRVAVLEDAASLTIEAQNALLKTLEELPDNALIILGVNSDSKLLPTVLSRCQIIRLQGTGDSEQKENHTADIKKLAAASLEERFGYVEKCKERKEFLQALVQYYHCQISLGRGTFDKEEIVFVKELLEAEKWAEANVNIRAILEYLMLVMPKKL